MKKECAQCGRFIKWEPNSEIGSFRARMFALVRDLAEKTPAIDGQPLIERAKALVIEATTTKQKE